MRVHDSQAYRKIDVTRERISRILELREILLSIQIGFSLVNAAVACAMMQSNSGLEPSSVITEPRYLKLVTCDANKYTHAHINLHAYNTRSVSCIPYIYILFFCFCFFLGGGKSAAAVYFRDAFNFIFCQSASSIK